MGGSPLLFFWGPTLARHDLSNRAEEAFAPLLQPHGLDLVCVEWVGTGRGATLRIYLDKEGGVNVDDCALASRLLASWIDECEWLPGPFTLEVSSPGLERPLRRPDHFRAHTGVAIKVRTYEAIAGRKNYRGVLVEIDDDGEVIALDVGDAEPIRIPLAAIAKANVEYDYENLKIGSGRSS